MKKTLIVNDLIWMTLSALICAGGLKLGFGSFRQPEAGFMPVLCGLLLGFLAFIDLISGIKGRWKSLFLEKNVWADTNFAKLLLTIMVLFIYVFLFSGLGFVASTILLLLFLFRLMESRPWWVVITASVITTGAFYVAFKIGLSSQLPRGLIGF